MKRTAALLSMSLFVLTIIFVFSLPVFAQEEIKLYFDPASIAEEALAKFNERNPGMDQKELGLEVGVAPADYGQKDWHHVWLGAADFMQDGVGNNLHYSGGYYGRASAGGSYFRAHIKLPSGSVIKRITLHCYDQHATSSMSMNVIRNWTDLAGSSELLLTMNTPSPGFGYYALFHDPLNFTYDNYHQYVIVIYMPDSTGLHRFKGVRIGYQRTISPAPSSASFSDVPTTHPFFQQIEALAAAGISTGWDEGDGTFTFRPDQPVTRMAMAAFLARALGLYHTDDDY